ncbi:hypothetical protein IT570_06785 [Candidatus Sumerlaeota bacterium]|nr:hypothetical protein [Candidatus Sumerlaeota bacterium]
MPGILALVALVVCWMGVCGHGDCAPVFGAVQQEASVPGLESISSSGCEDQNCDRTDHADHKCPCDSLKVYASAASLCPMTVHNVSSSANSRNDLAIKSPSLEIFQPPKLPI